ncbi:MAG: DUF2997 domain-containing protein [Candidatus Blackburnbacteria bacterium]|nr:DUF2997 domain-containing protein [Candidatus Blackburnbacteria bacterium]
MAGKRVEVIVDSDGTVRIDAIGFKGPACEKATAEIERFLRGPPRKTRKVEYNQVEVIKA